MSQAYCEATAGCMWYDPGDGIFQCETQVEAQADIAKKQQTCEFELEAQCTSNGCTW